MDVIVTLVQLSIDEFEEYVEEIEASNLPKSAQAGLIDLLVTALQHTKDARAAGWVP